MLPDLIVLSAPEPVSAAEVAQAAASLGIEWPRGYADFITATGEGTVSTWVRVYPPDRIVAEVDEFRERLREYWRWDGTDSVVTKEAAKELVPIADTIEGDEVALLPGASRLILLPRHEEVARELPGDLDQVLVWLCRSGELTAAIQLLYFEPWANRASRRYVLADGADTSGPIEALAAAMTGLASATERHDEEDGTFGWTWLLPQIGGVFAAFSDDDDGWASLDYDESTADQETLARIAQAAAAAGFTLDD